MSSTFPVAAILPTTNFQLVFNTALRAYEERTKTDILAHPLASQLQSCNSPGSILAVLQDQVDDLAQARGSDARLTKWLSPTINVLLAFSAILGEGVSLVFSPAKVIFAGAGVLLQAAKDVSAAQDVLIDIFERVDNFFKRLEIYTEVPPTVAMTDIIVKIMVEVLNIFAIATKEIKQGRTKKYLKKLVGKTDIEDALRRLDKLTQEEVRMASAQLLKVTHGVDDKVTRIDDGVKGVDDKVKDVCDTVKLVLDDGKETKVIVREATAIMQRMSNNVDKVKLSQWRQELRKWLSSPDPSTNHIILWSAQHEGTATWFFRGSLFEEWKSTGSLLWIHGKPGSGKSVLCSAVIQDIMTLRDAGLAFMAYFYFDFRDADKQDRRNLLLSLLSQLSARSDLCCDMLYQVYLTHDNGAHKPTDDVLIQILMKSLTFSDHGPIYIIMDALDECPNTFGLPSPRDLVLDLVKRLVEPSLPNLHICVTSRPEIDIRTALEPLTSCQVSLHDQTGQKKDIVEFVRSVVHSDARMGNWRDQDQNLVIETLSDRADGMFRWVFCQLETLRHCFPPSLRRVLQELPESLDETYERILKSMNKATRAHAHRLLQCLTVAVRPLRLEELAEVLALDFDEPLGGIPTFNGDWRREDQEHAVLSTCSSLITVAHDGESRVVQFSHFSVKEFLTSDRLATAIGDVSYHHISLEPAHTILAQACLSVLLCSDDACGVSARRSPLAEYAARHWVEHALFENVSSHVKDGMENLFDVDKPHFSRWIRIHDMDDWFAGDGTHPEGLEAASVYYAALSGFRDVMEKLIGKYPEHINSRGGKRGTALHAASRRNRLEVGQSLLEHGAEVNILCRSGRTPLHVASISGHLEIGQLLLEHGADVNAKQHDHSTPLHLAADHGYFGLVRILLRHNADVNAETFYGNTPLHTTSSNGHVDTARLLLENGAEVNALGNWQRTPLHFVSQQGHLELGRLLLEHGADVNAKQGDHLAPLHLAAQKGYFEFVQMLLRHNANTNTQTSSGYTPLHTASEKGHVDIARLLLEHGAEINAQGQLEQTPLHAASMWGLIEIGRLLLEHGADVNAKLHDHRTPLHIAAEMGNFELVQTFLRHNADVNAETSAEHTPLHMASRNGHLDIARLLLDHGADPKARGRNQETPLHLALHSGMLEVVRLLLEHGVDIDGEDDEGNTAYQIALKEGYNEIAQVLSEDSVENKT